MMHDILFLDVDGVLTNRKDDAMIFECPSDRYRLCDRNLVCLDKILNSCPNCRIVLSTSWRNYPEDYEFQNKLGWSYKSQLPVLLDRYYDKIIDKAPHVEGSNKAKDILKWIVTNQFEGKYIILDDDPMQGLSYFSPQWIKTSKELGLTERIADVVINYFNNNMLEIM